MLCRLLSKKVWEQVRCLSCGLQIIKVKCYLTTPLPGAPWVPASHVAGWRSSSCAARHQVNVNRTGGGHGGGTSSLFVRAISSAGSLNGRSFCRGEGVFRAHEACLRFCGLPGGLSMSISKRVAFVSHFGLSCWDITARAPLRAVQALPPFQDMPTQGLLSDFLHYPVLHGAVLFSTVQQMLVERPKAGAR